MVTVSETVIRFMSIGADKVVRDEDRVDKAISKTAKNAEKNEKKIGRWMERHKTALTAIGAAAAGAMAGVIAASPSLRAALSGVYLEFSMLAMDIGERWAPAFEWLEGIAGDIEEAWDKLPEPLKDVISYGLLVALGFLAIAGAAAGLLWLLGPLTAALGAEGLAGLLAGGLGLTTAAGGLTLLGAAVGVLGGLVLGGIVVWLLWKTGVLKAIEEAGARVGQFAYNVGVVFGNLKDNILEWLGLVAASAGLWGAQFALNWIDGIVSNIPFLGDLLGPKIDSLKGVLDQAGADLQKRWDEWNSSGGLREGLLVGVVTPAWVNDPSLMKHPFTDWLDRLFGGEDTSSQADRLQEMFASMPPVEIPGYSDSMQQLRDLQTQMEMFESTADESMNQVSQSMATMATNASTSSQSVVTTSQTTTATVAATYEGLVRKAPVWGSDLMERFIAGVNSKYGALLSTLARIRSAIESALSFDIVSNDRTAQRWGSDFVQHFNAGLASRPIELPEIPVPSVPEITIPVSVAAAAAPEMPTIPAEPRMIDTILGTLPDLPDLPRLSATIDMILGAVPDLPDLPRLSATIDMILGAVPEMPRLSATVDAVFSAMPDPMLRHAAPAGMSAPVAPAPVMPPAASSAGGSSTSTTYNTPVNVSVTVNVSGAQARDFDERRLATVVQEQIRDALRGKGR